jgi:hypothetical protein
VEMSQTLSEVKEALQSYETTALADVAATLAEAAESLAHTARVLHEMHGEEWMDARSALSSSRGRPGSSGRRSLPSCLATTSPSAGSSTAAAR